MKIGLFLPNWIGDAVMATPALRAIRNRYPEAEVVAILRPYVADVLAGLDLVDRTLHDDPRRRNGPARGRGLIRQLRAERFDLAVLFPNSFRSALVARLAGAKRRVGLARDGRGWLLTDRISGQPKSTPHPVIDEYLRIAEHLGCTECTRSMELAVLPEDERQLDRFRARHGERFRGRGVVSLNPGGAFGAAKHWPTQSFAGLARRIAVEQDKTVLVLCGPAERDKARLIASLADHPHVLSLADEQLSIGLTKAAVKSAELLVTTDSGPRHFAPPLGVPVITLFGPTHMAWSETYYDRAVHLQHEVDCGPCQQRVCPPGHHRCMRDLTVDRVYQAVVRMLNSRRVTRAAS